jgi:hypothetical protein
MNKHASLNDIIKQTSGQHPKQQALAVLIQGIRLAQSRGIFTLDEANTLAEKVMVFVSSTDESNTGSKLENCDPDKKLDEDSNTDTCKA